MKRSAPRVAVVTGGSRGIGRAIVLALVETGHHVALTYHHNRALAEEVVEVVSSAGGQACATPMTLQDCTSVKTAMADIRTQLGPPEVLVNNAAVAQEKPFDAITSVDWDFVMAANLRGPFLCCQEVLAHMQRSRWGRIINITSIGGQWGGFNQVHYATAKAGLISLTRSLARLYSPKRITTNAVAPGLVQTEMANQELSSPQGREKVKQIPIGRIGTVEDVADAVAFLASDSAAYITGQTINVNGGMYFG